MNLRNPLIIVLFLVTVTARSQEFNAGITGGLIASQLDGDRYEGYNKAGLTCGVFVNRYFTKKTAYQIGLRYIQKGSKRVDNKNNVYYISYLQYVEIPVSIRYNFKSKFDIETGVSVGYLIKAQEDFGSGFDAANPPFNNFELSGILGVNYQWTKNWLLGVQFNYSVTAARPYSSGYETFMDKGQHNNVVCISVAYLFSHWK